MAVAVAAATHPAVAEELSGKATVVQGDTIAIDGVIVHFSDVVAPAPRQSCRIYDVQWPCGRQAMSALQRMVAGREVICAVEEPHADGGVVATCWLDGEDIGEAMVRSGNARSRTRYGDAQLEAQRSSRGMWGGLVPEQKSD